MSIYSQIERSCIDKSRGLVWYQEYDEYGGNILRIKNSQDAYSFLLRKGFTHKEVTDVITNIQKDYGVGMFLWNMDTNKLTVRYLSLSKLRSLAII